MEKHNSCVNSFAIIQYLDDKAPGSLDQLFEDLGPEMEGIADPKVFLSDPNNWISSSLLMRLYDKAKQITHDENVAYQIGFNSVLGKHLGYIQRIVMYSFGSPGMIMKHIQNVNDHFNRTKEVQLLNRRRGSAVVRLLWKKDIPLSKDFCLMNKGVYQAVPIIFGLPPCHLEEAGCYFQGDAFCEYRLRWKTRNIVKDLWHRLMAPWRVAWASREELERDKAVLKEKYIQVYHLNQTLRQKIDQLISLQETSNAVLSTLKLEDVLDLSLKSLLNVAHLDRAAIFLSPGKQESLKLIHVVGVEEGRWTEFKGYEIPIDKQDNIIARVAGSRQPVFVEDVAKMNLNLENPLLKYFQPEAFILVPLTVRDQLVGVLVGDRRADRDFVKEIDQEFLTSFANQIAIAIENSNLYGKIEASERKYREIVENAHEGIWVLKAEGTVRFANRRLIELLGHEELIGSNVYGLVHEKSKKTFLRLLRENLEGRRAKEEVDLTAKNGEAIRVLLSSVPVITEGQYTGSLAMVTDLSEKKRMEDRLLQAQKLESVGTLAGGIAHDFNNILTGILGYAQLMADLVGAGTPQARYVEVIEQSTLRAADLVRQLLAFSRVSGSEEVMAAPVNTVVLESLELLRSSLPKNIEIESSLSKNLPYIECNPTNLQQVILNICVNARDAMPNGGTLSIVTGLAEPGVQYDPQAAPSAAAGRYLRITIRDTGVGIAPEIKERLFDPFFTTKEKGKGTGLGLAMVYGIVKNIGGNIFVESVVGVGTTFELLFPVAGTKVAPAAVSEKKVRSGGSETILVVDDEEIVRDLAADILSSMGYKVLLARDGVEALHIYKALGSSIGLVLLDLAMPRMDGRQVADELRSLSPGVKILFCSGHCDKSDMPGELLGGQHTAFTSKPFKVDELLAQVRELLDVGGDN